MKIFTIYNQLLLCASILATTMMPCIAKQQEKNNIAISIVDCSLDVKAPLLTTHRKSPFNTEQCLSAGFKPLRVFVWNKSNAPIMIARNSFNIPIIGAVDASNALHKSQIMVPWLKGTAGFFGLGTVLGYFFHKVRYSEEFKQYSRHEFEQNARTLYDRCKDISWITDEFDEEKKENPDLTWDQFETKFIAGNIRRDMEKRFPPFDPLIQGSVYLLFCGSIPGVATTLYTAYKAYTYNKAVDEFLKTKLVDTKPIIIQPADAVEMIALVKKDQSISNAQFQIYDVQGHIVTSFEAAEL